MSNEGSQNLKKGKVKRLWRWTKRRFGSGSAPQTTFDSPQAQATETSCVAEGSSKIGFLRTEIDFADCFLSQISIKVSWRYVSLFIDLSSGLCSYPGSQP